MKLDDTKQPADESGQPQTTTAVGETAPKGEPQVGEKQEQAQQTEVKEPKPATPSPRKKPAAPKAATKPKPATAKKVAGETKETTVKKTSSSASKRSSARKAPAKKSSKKSAARAARGFDENAKITVKLKENPRRKGSGAFKRLEKLMASNGKTVGTYLKGGGVSGTLRNAVNKKWATVSGS